MKKVNRNIFKILVPVRNSPRFTILARIHKIISNFCNGPNNPEKEIQQRKLQAEMTSHLDEIAHLEQNTYEKTFLYSNLVLILAGAIILYVYFSINPFTQEEIEELRQRANFTSQ